MTGLSFERYCTQIVTQTDLLRAAIVGRDMTTPVPSCPGWNVGQLVRHLGGGQRWLEEIVRTRATEPPPDEFFRDLSPYANEDPQVLDGWLAEGAKQLAETLRAAGPEAKVWTPLPNDDRVAFFARRFAHETLMHRCDAFLALDVAFTVDEAVAIDAVDEWMELGSLPIMLELKPEQRELLGPGRTLHFHATDSAAHAEWVVDLTGDTLAWRRAHEKCAVAVRGPLVDLLLVIYRRRPVESVEVLGDAELLNFWMQRVGFG